jgi:hypothetical protein
MICPACKRVGRERLPNGKHEITVKINAAMTKTGLVAHVVERYNITHERQKKENPIFFSFLSFVYLLDNSLMCSIIIKRYASFVPRRVPHWPTWSAQRGDVGPWKAW